jgi:hypothetical protein
MLERSRSLSVLVPNKILLDGKAAKEGGRSEMKKMARWRVVSRDREKGEKIACSLWVGFSERTSAPTHERRPFPAHPAPAGHFSF